MNTNHSFDAGNSHPIAKNTLMAFDDALYSTGTGLERVGVAGLDQDRWRVELEDVGSSGKLKDGGEVELWAPI